MAKNAPSHRMSKRRIAEQVRAACLPALDLINFLSKCTGPGILSGEYPGFFATLDRLFFAFSPHVERQLTLSNVDIVEWGNQFAHSHTEVARLIANGLLNELNYDPALPNAPKSRAEIKVAAKVPFFAAQREFLQRWGLPTDRTEYRRMALRIEREYRLTLHRLLPESTEPNNLNVKGGRPPKTAEVAEFNRLISAGMKPTAAAKKAGVSIGTTRNHTRKKTSR